MDCLRCTLELRKHIEINLANWQKLPTADLQGLRQAAVALCVVDYRDRGGVEGLLAAEADSAALVLTKRSSALKNHPGQWALPGGRREPGEAPEQTALRELSEEVGLDLPPENVIGFLDDFITRSGFLITPVVVWGGPGVRLLKNEHEVSSIHRIPCLELLRADAPVLEPGAGHHPILFMPVGNSWIAAPTAAILFQFREVALLGRNTRVAHYDQPAFAWR